MSYASSEYQIGPCCNRTGDTTRMSRGATANIFRAENQSHLDGFYSRGEMKTVQVDIEVHAQNL